MRAILFIILGAIGLAMIVMLLEAFIPKANAQEIKHTSQGKQKYDSNTLFKFTLDAHPEQTKQKAMEEYKKCPPLRPDRFSRRIKMLWGIDVDKFPDNALLWFGPEYKLSLKYQTIQGYRKILTDEEMDHGAPFPDNPAPPYFLYLPFRQYLLYNDLSGYQALYTYFQKFIDNEPKTKNGYPNEEYWLDGTKPDNMLADINRFIYFHMPVSLMQYMDKTTPINVHTSVGDLWTIGEILDESYVYRSTDMRNDMLTLYIIQEQKKGRKLANSNEEQNKQQYIRLKEADNQGYPNKRDKEGKLLMSIPGFYPECVVCWDNYREESYGRASASTLSQLLQLKGKSFDKAVLMFLSKQELFHNRGEMVSSIKKNNYFGYTLLREYDNNLMREMPTLAKIGTSFQGAVKQANTLLLLEPFKDSYDIDTLQTYETFTAYEMGHDDYYFVEVEKPVESPIAGTDGYAKIVDRTEIVHGYIEKAKVVPYTDAQLLAHPKFTDHTTSKRGVINDKDGYVNMRAERSTKAEVVEKIVTLGEFEYWQLVGNWYIVEKSNGKRGFVYKDRIKEKL